MLGRFGFLACALIANTCSADRRQVAPNEFALCSDNPAHLSRISIDLDKLYGFSEDTGRPVMMCNEHTSSCISWPILLSIPPRFPKSSAELVRWTVDDDKFSIRLIPGSDDTYFLEAVDFRSRADGRSVDFGKLLFVYDRNVGILSLKIRGDTPHGWVRCGGRLTFDDLRSLVAKLSKGKEGNLQ